MPLRRLMLALALITAAFPAAAHPHVLIESWLGAEADAQGHISAVTVRWAFDEIYSQTAIADFDDNHNRTLDPPEAAALAKLFMGNLAEWHYFTDVHQNDQPIPTGTPADAAATMDGHRLVIGFTLPLARPLSPKAGPVMLRSFDPSYYVAIDLSDHAPVHLGGGLTQGCGFAIVPGPGLGEFSLMSEQAFTSMPEPGQGDGIGGAYAQKVMVQCP